MKLKAITLKIILVPTEWQLQLMVKEYHPVVRNNCCSFLKAVILLLL